MANSVSQQHNRDWLRRLRNGDHSAFAEFVAQYQQMVFMCCRTVGLNDSESEDVASETFLAVYKGIGKYNGKSRLSSWLWKIAYNKSVNFLRKNGQYKQLHSQLSILSDKAKPVIPVTSLEKTEQAQLVWNAVERLPRLWALAIVLFYREEKSIKEIAKIMKKRENTVKTYLFRGRQKLKSLLSDIIGEDNR